MFRIIIVHRKYLIFGISLHLTISLWSKQQATFFLCGSTLISYEWKTSFNSDYILYRCFFDSINGWLAEILITTSPLTLIFLTNSILYLVVWYRIRSEERDIELFIGTNGTRIRKSHRAAKRMSLFVIAFLVQWFSLVLNGLWRGLAAIPAPDALFYAVTILPNIGGVLNGVVYYIIRPKGSERNGSEERTILSSKSISV